jgi:hypothetical protein
MRPNVSFTDDPNDALRRAELVCDTFARLDHRQLGFTTAVLWARRDMLAERTGVRRLGFLDLGTTTGPVELPAITTLVADMRSEYQIDLLAPDLLPATPPLTIAEAHFGDPHPDWWSDAAHSERRLIVLTSARAVDAYPTIQSFLIGCWAAVVPLALYAFDTGIGSRRPHA